MINRLIDEINQCLDNKCYLSALMVALTLPDICGKVEYPTDKPSVRYKKWYKEWIGQYEHDPDDKDNIFPYPSEEIVYDLRCSMFHEGNPSVNLTNQNLTDFKLVIYKEWNIGGVSDIASYNGDYYCRTLEIGVKNLIWKLCRLAEVYYAENNEKFNFNYTLVERNY